MWNEWEGVPCKFPELKTCHFNWLTRPDKKSHKGKFSARVIKHGIYMPEKLTRLFIMHNMINASMKNNAGHRRRQRRVGCFTMCVFAISVAYAYVNALNIITS